MLNKNQLSFIACEAEYEEAKIVLFGAPFDGTSSYRPGSRFAPQAMRTESYGLETYSPYQDRNLLDLAVFDSGDLELPFGDTQRALALIEERVHTIMRDGKRPLMLGGEHLTTLAALRAALKHYPELRLLHFDAHADLRDEYLGVRLSHACVMRRCWELLGDGRIFQFGIRSGDREEFLWAAEGHVSLRKFDFQSLENLLRSLERRPVYLSIDLDVLDPSIFPGTGTPEPGGVSFMELFQAMQMVCQKTEVIACDLNELSPPYDPSGISIAAACKLAREMILAM